MTLDGVLLPLVLGDRTKVLSTIRDLHPVSLRKPSAQNLRSYLGDDGRSEHDFYDPQFPNRAA